MSINENSVDGFNDGIEVNLNDLKAVLAVASQEEIRPYLKGVFIEIYSDSSIGMIATDGTIILKSNTKLDVEDVVQSFIIPRKAIENFIKISHKMEKFCLITSNSISSRCDKNIKIQFEPINGTFPEWRKPFKNRDKTENFDAIHTSTLESLTKVSKILKKPMEIQDFNLNPVVVSFDSVDGLFMKMKNLNTKE